MASLAETYAKIQAEQTTAQQAALLLQQDATKLEQQKAQLETESKTIESKYSANIRNGTFVGSKEAELAKKQQELAQSQSTLSTVQRLKGNTASIEAITRAKQAEIITATDEYIRDTQSEYEQYSKELATFNFKQAELTKAIGAYNQRIGVQTSLEDKLKADIEGYNKDVLWGQVSSGRFGGSVEAFKEKYPELASRVGKGINPDKDVGAGYFEFWMPSVSGGLSSTVVTSREAAKSEILRTTPAFNQEKTTAYEKMFTNIESLQHSFRGVFFSQTDSDKEFQLATAPVGTITDVGKALSAKIISPEQAAKIEYLKSTPEFASQEEYNKLALSVPYALGIGEKTSILGSTAAQRALESTYSTKSEKLGQSFLNADYPTLFKNIPAKDFGTLSSVIGVPQSQLEQIKLKSEWQGVFTPESAALASAPVGSLNRDTYSLMPPTHIPDITIRTGMVSEKTIDFSGYASFGLYNRLSDISQSAKTSMDSLLRYSDESNVAVKVIEGAGSFFTSLPQFGGQIVLGSEAWIRDFPTMASAVIPGTKMFVTDTALFAQEHPAEFTGQIGAMLLTGKVIGGINKAGELSYTKVKPYIPTAAEAIWGDTKPYTYEIGLAKNFAKTYIPAKAELITSVFGEARPYQYEIGVAKGFAKTYIPTQGELKDSIFGSDRPYLMEYSAIKNIVAPYIPTKEGLVSAAFTETRPFSYESSILRGIRSDISERIKYTVNLYNTPQGKTISEIPSVDLRATYLENLKANAEIKDVNQLIEAKRLDLLEKRYPTPEPRPILRTTVDLNKDLIMPSERELIPEEWYGKSSGWSPEQTKILLGKQYSKITSAKIPSKPDLTIPEESIDRYANLYPYGRFSKLYDRLVTKREENIEIPKARNPVDIRERLKEGKVFIQKDLDALRKKRISTQEAELDKKMKSGGFSITKQGQILLTKLKSEFKPEEKAMTETPFVIIPVSSFATKLQNKSTPQLTSMISERQTARFQNIVMPRFKTTEGQKVKQSGRTTQKTSAVYKSVTTNALSIGQLIKETQKYQPVQVSGLSSIQRLRQAPIQMPESKAIQRTEQIPRGELVTRLRSTTDKRDLRLRERKGGVGVKDWRIRNPIPGLEKVFTR